ncbi:hypothetical protein O6H91_03G087000 [Diphasiastrum complanatum]|nr:hypothetical protein O6H91_03G087000 [Diphasiastrum complanatum]
MAYCECGVNCTCSPCTCSKLKKTGESFCKCGSNCTCEPCTCAKPFATT